MARPRPPERPVHLRSARMLDVDRGELVEPGDLLIDGERIVEIAPASVPTSCPSPWRRASRTFLVATTYLTEAMDVSHAAPELQAKAADVFPRSRATITKAIERGVKIACGTDAPAIPHGRNAKELLALVDRGMTPLQAVRAATTVAADLIDVDDRGRLEAGLLADIIAVPGDPLTDIGVTEQVRFVMKGGRVFRHDEAAEA